MKNFILTVSIFSSFVFPAAAEDLCRADAQDMGYVGAVELLIPWEISPNEQPAEKV